MDNIFNNPSDKGRWYNSGYKVAMAGFVGLVLVCVLAFAVVVAYYTWQIKTGHGEEIAAKIKALDEARVKPDPARAAKRKALETAEDPYIGAAAAPIVIVEFLDYKCPFCKETAPILKQLAQKHGQEVKIIFRDYPVDSLHPGASAFGAAVACAGEQGGFWLAHDYMFRRQDELGDTWSDAYTHALASDTGLNEDTLRSCLESRRGTLEVNSDFADGFQYGVRGTPTFFVNGEYLQGVIPFSVWEEIISKY